MNSMREKILAEALELSEEERLALADDLYLSVPDEPTPLHPKWDGEIRRRIAEIEAGTATMIPGDEFMRKLKGLLSGRE